MTLRTFALVSSTLLALPGMLLRAQTQSPYGGTNGTIANGSVIQAENYDLGGEGVAYHDTTAGNTGAQFRADGVDIEACTDAGGGFNIGWLIDGEWLEYTVDATTGTYTITARVASAGTAIGDLRVVLDGVVLGTMAVNATGGWQTFADVSLTGVAIAGGTNRVLRLEVVNGGDFNVNTIRFTSTGATPTATARPTATATTQATATATTRATATPTTPAGSCAIGATCEAESALLGGGVVTSTLHAGYTGSGFADYAGNGTGFVEWTVSVPTAGTYNLNIRYGNGGTGDRPMAIAVNGTTVVSSLSFPVTGWTTWTVRTQAVSLPAGTAVKIRATELPNGPNVDNLVVTAGSATATATATTRATATATTRATNTSTATATSTTRPTATSTARPTATTAPGTNLAQGKPIVASSVTQTFVATNANDGSVTTYWEGAAPYPNTLTVSLGTNASITSVIVKLNPDPLWATRTQTIEVLGHGLGVSTFTTLVAPATYTFNPATTNTVTIPLSATASDVRLTFTANSGAAAGQVAEFQVMGTAGPTPTATATTPPTPTPTTGPAPSGADTMVHLFEWSWSDVAIECETHLGPKGFKAVQVSPPNEHINDTRWWGRYQPVSYRIESYSGTRAQFIDMVTRCRTAGVDIYADMVFNHTASLNGGGVGSAGTTWSLKSHPMYSSPDYHNSTCTIDYQNASTVQTCDLVGLPDLNTGAAYVQQTEANFANDLLAIGVNGFRIDAAKHMAPGDLSGIYGRFSRASTIYQEVIDLGGEAVKSTDYTGLGSVEEFKYSRDIGAAFKGGAIRTLQTLGEASGLLPSAKAVVFTDNHDNQRGHGAGGNPLTYKDGGLYDLGNVFMLAWPYGYPRVMSSYDFTDTDIGPPGVPVHQGATLNCFGTTWKCEHRWRSIANMVAFRRAAAGAAVSNWWDNGANQVAFSRTARGFVVINREAASLTRTFTTGLPAGTYCNVFEGDFAAGACSGPTIVVNASGQATITVASMRAAAIHVNAKL